MKELVKPVKEVVLLNVEGYCENNGACGKDSGQCGFNGCSNKSYSSDNTSDEILF